MEHAKHHVNNIHALMKNIIKDLVRLSKLDAEKVF